MPKFPTTRRQPHALPDDPTIGVWTPSSPAPGRFPRRLARALNSLTAHGYGVRLAPSATGDDGLMAASPEVLAADLHDLLTSPDIDAVMCSVGGYTSLGVLPHLDFQLIADAAKPIIGYSDATAVLWACLAQAGLITFHGPMVVSEWGEHGGPLPHTADSLRQVLDGRPTPIELRPPGVWTDEFLFWDRDDDRPRALREGEWRCLVPGRANGWLLAGCAPTVSCLFGTPYLPDVDGAILCLETPEGASPEEFYGLLAQWSASGALDRVNGLVIGRYARPPGGAAADDFDRVVLAALAGRAVPVLVDVDFGHTEPRLTLPLGTDAVLDATELTLTVVGSPVRRR